MSVFVNFTILYISFEIITYNTDRKRLTILNAIGLIFNNKITRRSKAAAHVCF